MKIGFDLTQAMSTRAGCGRYAEYLFSALKSQNDIKIMGYRDFANWFVANPVDNSDHLVNKDTDPLFALSRTEVFEEWHRAMKTGIFPGGPDIVHSCSFQAPKLNNAALIVTIFDLSFWAKPSYTTERIRVDCQSGILDALAHADGLIFTSDHSRIEFDRFIPKHRRSGSILTTTIPLASYFPRINPAGIASRGDYWLFVGTREPRKNISGLLESYRAYRKKSENPHPLMLVGGEGWQQHEWKDELQDLVDSGAVRMQGYVLDSELPDIYRSAIGILLPSWYEGFGLPVLEAMAMGCPVICSDNSSLSEVGGSAAIFINPKDPVSLTQAMLRLESNPDLREELRVKGFEQELKFSWERTARLTLEFYNSVYQTWSNRT